MAQVWDGTKWVGAVAPESVSQDYKTFAAFTPEQQQNIGSSGVTFDNKDNFNLSGLANSGSQTSWWDNLKNSFNPNEKGVSKGGQILDNVDTTVGALTGLAGMYYADKNFKLQKEAQDYAKSRDALGDQRVANVQANYDAARKVNG